MNYKTSKTLKAMLMALLVAMVMPARAKDVYGFMTGNSSDGDIPIGMYKFDTETLKPELLTSLMYQFWGGAYADGKYMMILSDDATGYLTEGLCTYDINSKKLKLRYSQQPYQCSDLTYDYSTSTLYGVMTRNTGESVTPRLIKIDTKSGKYTKVGELSAKIVGLACTYFGDMYAIDSDGKLYEMDKSSGELSLIGSTGMAGKASEAQSLEFDRATEELYWSGLDDTDNTFFCQIDPATAQVVKKNQLSDNSLIVGLHIPFSVADPAAPAKPEGLQADVADGGVTLSWTNPTQTYGGSPLADGSLTKMEVWKAGRLIATIDNPEAGKAASYTDTDIRGGKVRYVVYAYNEAGRGEGASVRVLAGEDIPGAVTNLKATKIGNKVRLTWTAPAVGKNGGGINPDGLTYTVTRHPDGAVFGEVTDTVFTDPMGGQACYYTWSVACRNDVGKGDAATTDPAVLAGTPLTTPYAVDFDGDLWRHQWRVVDNNGDGNTWTTSDSEFLYYTSYTNTADDSLVSVPFSLKRGVHYVVRYGIMAPSMFSSEHFRLSLKGDGGESVLEDLNDFSTPGYTDAETRSVSFTVAADGDYQFCMAALSKADQFFIKITAFEVTEEQSVDLCVTSLQADGQPIKGKEATFRIGVGNVGLSEVHSYTVKLLDTNGNELASKVIDSPLAYRGSVEVALSHTPSAHGTLALKAVVKADGDANAANDTLSAVFNTLCMGDTVVEMGGKDYYTDFPFWFSGYEYSYTQAIYTGEELDGNAGSIHQLQYDYVNNGADLANKHIKVYLANTSKASVVSGWTDEADMTLVVDTTVTFLSGGNTLLLDLHTPFAYTGGNLCIMTQKHDTEQSDDIYFYATATDEPRTAIYNGDDAQVDLSRVQASTRLNHVRVVKADATDAGIAASHACGGEFKLRAVGSVVSVDGADDVCFTVTDLGGNTVAVWRNTKTISLSMLPAGVYIVKAKSGGWQTAIKVAR